MWYSKKQWWFRTELSNLSLKGHTHVWNWTADLNTCSDFMCLVLHVCLHVQWLCMVFAWVCVGSLTIHCHPHVDAFLKATQLALVPGDLVDDAAAIVFTGVRWVEVLLDCAPEKSLKGKDDKMRMRWGLFQNLDIWLDIYNELFFIAIFRYLLQKSVFSLFLQYKYLNILK